MKHSAFFAAVGVATEQLTQVAQDPNAQIMVTVGGAAISFIVVEFLKGAVEGYKRRRADRRAGI